MEPYEIIGAPFTLWLAPVGESFPLIDADPAGNWVMIGTSGDENYTEDGVQVGHDQTISKVFTAGTTGPRKAFREREELMISLTLMDMTLEQYLYALNSVEVTTTAAGSGTAGFKKMGLSQGEEITLYALLARGPSAYGAGFNAQYEVPRCFQSGSPRPVFTKGRPTGVDLEFTALEDQAASTAAERFGRLVQQHQAPLA